MGNRPEMTADYASHKASELHQHPIVKEQRNALSMPPLFFSSAQTQILVMIGANGPMTVREMARARSVDSASTFRTTERLERSGLVVKRELPGGRKYISVNRSHVAYRNLSRLLEVLVDHYQIPRVAQARYRHGLPLERDPSPALQEDKMFGSVLRSRLLVLLAAVEEADVTQLGRLLGANRCSVDYTAHALLKSRLLLAETVGIRNVYRLNDNFVGAQEYTAFLSRLLREAPVYSILKSLLPQITFRWR